MSEWTPTALAVVVAVAIGAVSAAAIIAASICPSERAQARKARERVEAERALSAHYRALREQIEREVRADMFRGVRAWVERFSTGDRWDPQDAIDLESALLGTVEANPDRSRARGEGDAHRPERCPTCGCELAYPTAVHVVDCGEWSE